MWVLSGAEELCLLSLLLGEGLAVVVPLTVVCFCASSCGAGGLSAACPAAGSPSRVKQTFLAPVACPAPAVELCLLGLQCLGCDTWFSTVCRTFLPGPAVLGSFPCRRLPACGFCHHLPGLLLSRWLRLGCNPPPCVLSASHAPAGPLGFFTLCQGAPMWAVTALWVTVWGCLMAPHSSSVLCLTLSSPPAVLTLCGCCALFTAWFPLPLGGCASGLRCLRRQFAVGSAISAAPCGWSSFSGLCWSFTCSCGEVVWSHVCDPSCCSCVLSSCGVFGALFCRLGLLRSLPCRIFACGFPWFHGPSSWCFLGLFPMVISSRFRWLRLARGSCCLRFVQGPLPQAGAVFLACVSLGGCTSLLQVGPASLHWVPLLWSWCACGLPLFPPPVFSFGTWSPVGSIGSFCPS